MTDAYLFITRESIDREQWDMATVYVQQALDNDPTNQEALQLKNKILSIQLQKDEHDNIQKATEYYHLGMKYFEQKKFRAAAEAFDKSCDFGKGNVVFGGACTNAIYCRANIMDWGYNGTQFEKDMETIEQMTQNDQVYMDS